MRPPILFLTIGFAVGLFLGEAGRGTGDRYVAVPVLLVAALLVRRAPVGAAVAVMGVAGRGAGHAAGRV